MSWVHGEDEEKHLGIGSYLWGVLERGHGCGICARHEGYWEQRGAHLERADPTSEKGRGDAADTTQSYLADRDTAGAAANGTHGP